MTPTPDDLMQRALDRFMSQGGPFVLPEGSTALLAEPPGGLPPDTKLNAALPTPLIIPRPAPRDPAPTPPPGTRRAVVTADAVLAELDHVVWSVSPDGAMIFLIDGAVERLLGHPAEYYLDSSEGWFAPVPDGERKSLRAAFAGLPTSGSFVHDHTAGGRQVVSRGRLVRQTNGQPLCVVGTTVERAETATERDLRTKLAAAEAAQRDTAQLAILGRLVSGVSHDFNNCLMVVSGQAELLSEKLSHDHILKEPAGEIIAQIAATKLLARMLVAIGKPTTDGAGPCDPNAVVRTLEPLLRHYCGPKNTFDVCLAKGVNPIPVGDGALAQVLLNLVGNARDAIPQSGTVGLRTAEVIVDAAHPNWPPLQPLGKYVVLSVADTGEGVSDEVRAKMFDPYYTTKGAAGNGVGLATVAGIVRSAGGHIEVKSSTDWGTTIRVYFPAARDIVPLTVPMNPARTATVSLVQGEERARLYAGPIDVVATDVGLPT